jgi:hypothetical protein
LGPILEHHLGKSTIRDARLFLRDTELIPKTVRFMFATGLLDQFANYANVAKTHSPLE